MRTTSTTSWKRKQPSPGPRSASSGSPLYWTGPGLIAPLGRCGPGAPVEGPAVGWWRSAPARIGSARAWRSVSVTSGNDTGVGRRTPPRPCYHRTMAPDSRLDPPVRGVALRLAPGAGADRRRRRGGVARRRSRRSGGRPGPPRSTTSSTRRSAGRSGTPDRLRRPAPDVLRGATRPGPRDGPGPAPPGPTPSAEVLAEFRDPSRPVQLNAWHPRSLSYFTPPPLPMSIVGELLAQFTNQGIDVWHAGPIGAFVEEEVGRWLCDLVGYGPASFGILTSGGVMANLMAMTVARDVHLRRAPRARPAAARARARGRPGLRLGPDPLLDRPGARRARLPARDAPSRPGRRALPAARRRRSPRRSPPTGPPGLARGRSRPSPARRTRARST